MYRTPEMLRGMKLDIYWDGAAKPAVSAPLGDFFCQGLGRMVKFRQSAFFASPEGRSFNCFIPMPFRTGMKVVITNETDSEQTLFWTINYTLGDQHGPNALYFHAHYRRENPTIIKKDYEILPRIYGCGRYLGVNIGVIANKELYYNSWWGEGEVKIYLDGDQELPTLCGTGTEDYVGTAWGQGYFDDLYHGCTLADNPNEQYCFYRFHIPDPVYFRKDIRVTIQQIGCWGPESKANMLKAGRTIYKPGPGLQKIDLAKEAGDFGIFERENDDWSSCVYFYLDKPVNNLPEIDSVEKRIKGLNVK